MAFDRPPIHHAFSMRPASVLASMLAVALALAAFDAASVKPRGKPAAREPAPPPALIARPTPFSSGPLAATAPPGWVLQTLPKVERQTRYDLVNDGDTIVLRARADGSASSLRHGLFADPKLTPLLRWRWRTERVLEGADVTRKDGDDFSARLYVFFDRSEDSMTLKERAMFKLGRARYGDQLPSAALCYVWDNRQPVGSIFDNAYTPFVAMVVVSSGGANVGQWVSLQRDIAEDYRRAFNTAPPRITGVAVSVDTDNTGEATTSYFGDIEFVGAAKR